MSVAVCRSSTSGFESILMLSNRTNPEPNTSWLISPLPLPLPPTPTQTPLFEIAEDDPKEEQPRAHSDIWASIQSQKEAHDQQNPAYVHPLLRRSSSLLTQKSLEVCTESLGSETGSDDYFSSDDETSQLLFSSASADTSTVRSPKKLRKQAAAAAPTTVNYSSASKLNSSRPFPPPLPSISRRDGPCFQMRPHRCEGRLIVERVEVPWQNFLHAERRNGRLLLSFFNPTTTAAAAAEEHQEEEEEEQKEAMEVVEEEEEVEVVDRGTIVEVKVSTQPQQQSGGPATLKVHRSSIVINKFVSCNDQTTQSTLADYSSNTLSNHRPANSVRKLLPSTATTTAAAAAVAASSVSVFSEEAEAATAAAATENKLLFTSKRRNREELLHEMRRCSQLKKPLFIWEPCCIATSS